MSDSHDIEPFPHPVRFVGPLRRYHAGPSGYERLSSYLRGRPAPVPPPSIARAGRAASARVPQAWRSRMLRPIQNRWYGRERFLQELATIPTLLGARTAVVHHLYAEESYRLSGWVPRLRGTVLVGTYHQPPRALPDYVGEGRHLRRLDAVIGVSTSLTTALSEHVEHGRAHYVPHGVDTEYFTPRAEPSEAGRSLLRCLFIGYWLRDFDALDRALRELEGDDVFFDLILTPGKARRFAGRERVRVRSGLDDEGLREAYRNADALVLPLLDSTANNAVLEAMACGLPVVTTETSGMRDYVDESCGFLSPVGDSEAIALAVRRLIDDRDTARALGRAARRRAERDFAWPVVARRICAVYRRCLEQT